MSKKYANIKVNKLPKSEIDIEGEITKEAFQEFYQAALQKAVEEAELPGFRKGKAPQDVVIQKVGKPAILQEAANAALNSEYGNIISEQEIQAMGSPQITITKLAEDNPLGFKLRVATNPEVKLPDYKKIAKEINSKDDKEVPEVTDKEVDDFITNIRKQRAQAEKGAKAEAESKGPEKEGEKTEESKDEPKDAKKESRDKKEEELPPLDDEFVKSLGEFKDVDDFKKQVKENMKKDKENKAKEKNRIAIAEEILKNTEIEVPETIIESEINQLIAEFKSNIEQSGLSYEDYLTHVKKSEDDFRKEWRDNAEKKAKLQFVLNEIAKKEDIEPTEEEIKAEMEKIMEVHKDANRFQVRMYVDNFLANKKAFDFLESQK